MRTTTWAACVALASLALTACGSDDSSDSDGGSAGGKDHEIALVQGRSTDEYYITMGCGAKEAGERLGVDVEVTGPEQFEPSEQIQVLNGIAATQPDALLIAATDREALMAPLDQIAANGAKVIEVDAFTNGDAALARIGSENEEGGRLQARMTAKGIGERGRVLIVGLTPGLATMDDRQNGFIEEMKRYPEIDVLPVQYAQENPEKTSQIVNATLERYPDLAAVVSAGLFTTENIANSVRNAGKAGELKVYGFDATPAEMDLLREGAITGLIAQNPREMGRLGVEQAVAALEGETIPKSTPTSFVEITKENIDSKEAQAAAYKPKC